MRKILYSLILARIVCAFGLIALFLAGLEYAYAEVIAPGGTYQRSVVSSTRDSDPKNIEAQAVAQARVVATPVFDESKTYIYKASKFQAVWDCATPLHEIKDFMFAIGTTPGGNEVTGYMVEGGWLPILQSKLISGEYRELKDGKTYYFSVKAKNNAGSESAVATSRGIVAGE